MSKSPIAMSEIFQIDLIDARLHLFHLCTESNSKNILNMMILNIYNEMIWCINWQGVKALTQKYKERCLSYDSNYRRLNN